MFKRIAFLIAVTAIFIITNVSDINNMTMAISEFSDVGEEYQWAKEAIAELGRKGTVSGVKDDLFLPGALVTKEQLAAMISKGFDIENTSKSQTYIDVMPDRWSFDFVEATKDIVVRSDDLEINVYDPSRPQTRAEVAASCVKALSLEENDLKDKDMLSVSFIDHMEIKSSLSGLVAIATEKGIVRGNDGYLRPNDYVTRAEAAVMVCRAIDAKDGTVKTDVLEKIIGEPQITAKQAQDWAKRRGADKRFIDVAEIYWKYGSLTGINPEVLYGQAAKETNFGKYTGNVKPEQNNWAGIKIYSPGGDKQEDHETFSSADDGVRAHFNHMSAYVGLAPIGEPHDRYSIVASREWSGTVEYVEQLSGKWAPADDYGKSIMENYVEDMRKQ